VAGQNNSADDEAFYSPPVINENGEVIFKGIIDGREGIHCFTKSGVQKWYFASGTRERVPPALGSDGTIYVVEGSVVFALSPSGRIVWREGFDRAYNKLPALAPDGSIYMLVKINTSPYLVKLTGHRDNTFARENIMDLSSILNGETIYDDNDNSEIVFDEQDNLYFAIKDMLLGFNANGQKILEKKIGPVFSPDYVINNDETVTLKEIIYSNNILLVNAERGYCNKERGCRNYLYAFNINNMETPLWAKTIDVLLGASSEEAYFKLRLPTYTSSVVYLYACSLLTGEQKWIKSAGGLDMSMVTIDNQKHLYLSLGDGSIYGVDTAQATDELLDHAQVFRSYIVYSYNSYPIAIGQNVLYSYKVNQIYQVTY